MQPSELPAGLPQPDRDSLVHSELVRDYLRERIAAADGIAFGEYMHYALYAPGLGYYVSGLPKFARAGDFITAPEESPLFGRVVARQLAPVLAAIDGGSVLELGAGSGALAEPLLQKLAEADSLPERYLILEVSPDLAERQRQRFAAGIPDLARRIEWVDSLPKAFCGAIIANEVADALPVERFRVTPGGIEQAWVTAGEDGVFHEDWRPAGDSLVRAVQALGLDLPDGYVSDISLGLKPWVGELADALENGLILLIDYGLPRREYYAPDKSGGWLRCHFRHRVHDRPLVLPGIQDISAWVDFTAVAEAAAAHDAAVAGFVTQAMFLLAGGLENEFSAAATSSERQRAELAGAVKRLTLPAEMGEHFKCIGLTKGNVPVPAAFAAADRAQAL